MPSRAFERGVVRSRIRLKWSLQISNAA